MPFWKLSQLKIIVTLGLLPACASYDLTLNDKLIIRSQHLFTDYQIEDRSLSRCIKQAIVDNNISQAYELEHLNCSHAGIASLNGLEGFPHLRRARLSHNEIRDIDNIRTLHKLEVLQISNNHIINPLPALNLLQLRELDVSHNPNLKCPTKLQLAKINKIMLPKHCK